MDTTVQGRRRWVPAIGVLGIVVLLSAGTLFGPMIASPSRGHDVEVADGVRVRALDGWVQTGGGEVVGWQAVRLARGPAVLRIATRTIPLSSAALLDEYVTDVMPATVRGPVFGEPEALTLDTGRSALALGYLGIAHRGVPIEGVLVVVTGSDHGVVFDAVAPHGDLVDSIDDIRSMVGSAEVT